MKIMVVDDDTIALTMVKRLLMREKHEVILAENGETALELLNTHHVRIVITDWNMPQMDGIDLCQRLRAAPSFGYVYVILVTARSSKEEMLAGLWAGADDFISKPFEPAELLLKIRNAERLLSLESSSSALRSVAHLVESTNSGQSQRLERIREYARILASRIAGDSSIAPNLPHRFAELIYRTSPLLDIGMIGVRKEILTKRGPLNETEQAELQRHCEIGGRTFEKALEESPGSELLRFNRDIAWSHHEHWDGNGYPRGLKGDDIPLAARIVALADAYDASSAPRDAESALPHSAACEAILEGLGTQFDPRLIKVFVDCEKDIQAMRERFLETGATDAREVSTLAQA